MGNLKLINDGVKQFLKNPPQPGTPDYKRDAYCEKCDKHDVIHVDIGGDLQRCSICSNVRGIDYHYEYIHQQNKRIKDEVIKKRVLSLCRDNGIWDESHVRNLINCEDSIPKKIAIDIDDTGLPYSIFMHGSTGTSKTTNMIALFYLLLRKNVDVGWVSLSAGMNPLEFVDRDVLFIDDIMLGVTKYGQTYSEDDRRKWLMFFDKRFAMGKRNVLISNDDIDGFRLQYGSSSASRALGKHKVIKLDGFDLREEEINR